MLNVHDFGARCDGRTIDSTAMQATVDHVSERGGGTVHFPAGTYVVDRPLRIHRDNVRLVGEGPNQTIFKKVRSTVYVKAGGQGVIGSVKRLGYVARPGDRVLQLAYDNLSGSQKWMVLTSNAKLPFGSQQAEFVCVREAENRRASLEAPIWYQHETGDRAWLSEVSLLKGFAIEGIGFDGCDFLHDPEQINRDNVLDVSWCYAPEIRNVAAWRLPNMFLGLTGCIGARVDGLTATEQWSNGNFSSTGWGYSVCELGLNLGLVAHNIFADRVRHAYTTATMGNPYGQPMGSLIADSTAINCRGAGWDTHPPGDAITFRGCTVLGSTSHGIQVRSANTEVADCMVVGADAAGLKVHELASGTSYRGLRTRNCGRDVLDYGTNTEAA